MVRFNMPSQGFFRPAALACAGLLLAVGASGPAFAAPAKVYAPRVEKGVLELEADTVKVDDETETRFEVGYGVTKWWRATSVVEVTDEPGRGPRVDAYTIENIVVLPRPKWLPFEWGAYAEYEVGARRGIPDKLELKALFAGEVGRFDNRVNLIAERETGGGAHEPTEYEYAAQTRFRFNDDFALGLQASGGLGDSDDFGRISRREHVIGPMAAGELHIPGLPGELEFEAGYFFAVTDAATDVARVQVAWERKF